ncbi:MULTISPECIES: preprotein translocase subunit SecG [Sphingobacterium]|uniref:Protein-export membrane protein SecG n=1 Tax=Sphingobacterium corticibacter TaxID=2171749 RepID=A0A2T8HFK3_9SPHI|nr:MULTISPECIES: preprotein translocase subunit SecG [Sphingobacterium]PVH24195.1 preprotein translocase subunit SecG [Sphingobacterium corticibacter]
MVTLIIILIVLASVLLGLIVLIQNPKGGGLSSGFAGGSNLMGVQRTGDFLEKGTWALAIALMVFCLGLNMVGPSGSTGSSDRLNDQLEAPMQNNPGLNIPTNEAPAPTAAPAAGDTSAN